MTNKDNGGPASDRELLEMAAIACGEIPNSWRGNDAYFDGVLSRWNPLTDDGDALRLAVKMQMQITPGTYNKDEFGAFCPGGGEAYEIWSTQQDDFAATRRAIVRAAAAIGSAM